MKRFIMIVLLLQSVLASSLHVCIVIHGTWANSETWWQPGGDFFESLKKDAFVFCDDIVAFPWSGRNTSYDRREAAKRLAEVIKLYDQVTIVAHSHGATVGILASRYLAKDYSIYEEEYRFKIANFYALGVPVDQFEGLPDMNVIERFYNLFSFNDQIQPVFGMFERTFTQHDRIANLSVTIDGKGPNHSQLHDPVIGRDLLKIIDYFFDYTVNNFEAFSFWRPGLVEFYSQEYPGYSYDRDREYLLSCDKDMVELLMLALTRSKQSYRNNQQLLEQHYENWDF